MYLDEKKNIYEVFITLK